MVIDTRLIDGLDSIDDVVAAVTVIKMTMVVLKIRSRDERSSLG